MENFDLSSIWKRFFVGRSSLPLFTCIIIRQQQLVELPMEDRHVRK